MPLPIGTVIASLMRLGATRRVQLLLAICLPVIAGMKSPCLRLLMTSMLPQMMATSFRHMTADDTEAVLKNLREIVKEYEGKVGSTEGNVAVQTK